MADWTKRDNEGFIAWEATRPDNTYMRVNESVDSTEDYPLWDILVMSPSGDAEYLYGGIEDATPQSLMERAEEVDLATEATGSDWD